MLAEKVCGIVNMELASGLAQDSVFFQTEGFELEVGMESYVAASLIPSMLTDARIQVPGQISRRFYTALDRIQSIFSTWRTELEPVDIQASDFKLEPPALNAGVGAFFTGGVDSFYTLIKHQQEISHLIYIHGFHVKIDNADLRMEVSHMLHKVAREFGKEVIEIETNLRDVLDSYISWIWSHGAALASIGHLLKGTLGKIYIPASYTYAHLFPWGSHPVLDPLWSSEALTFVHDGCEATRVEKIERISQIDVALTSLRVCFQNSDSSYNCGKCEKCIRTMMSLDAVGALDSCTTFHEPLLPGRIAGMNPPKETQRVYFEENLEALQKSDVDQKIIAR